ncbi:hypothetical protein JX266_009437 [Neoarthrinium moseri]|nr:hypothetical protein JX266_009437 [Neoarthrinium moseri]
MSRAGKLAPEVNRALFVKNLSYNVTPEDLFELFGKFGPIRQVRQGIATNTKGTAFVVYEDVMDAKQACDKLNGFNFQGRYLVVLYHQPEKMARSKEDLEARKENLAQLKQKHDYPFSSNVCRPVFIFNHYELLLLHRRFRHQGDVTPDRGQEDGGEIGRGYRSHAEEGQA